MYCDESNVRAAKTLQITNYLDFRDFRRLYRFTKSNFQDGEKMDYVRVK